MQPTVGGWEKMRGIFTFITTAVSRYVISSTFTGNECDFKTACRHVREIRWR